MLKMYKERNKQLKGIYIQPSASSYKNHIAIIEAMKKVNKKEVRTEMVFTIDGSENKYAAKIAELSKEVLGIKCVGGLSRDELFRYYSKYGIIMTSKVESFGMPLLEAKIFQTVVVAIDYPYTRELLKGYNRSYLVSEDKLDQAIIEGLKDNKKGNYREEHLNSWKAMIDSIGRLAKEQNEK